LKKTAAFLKKTGTWKEKSLLFWLLILPFFCMAQTFRMVHQALSVFTYPSL